MLLNQTNLASLNTGFKALFNEGLGMAPDQWSAVAQLVPSDGPDEKYGWMKDIPGLRKWLGDRVVHSLALGDYAIRNEDYEETVAVDTNAIDDDKIGVLAPRFRMMGRAVAAFPNQLVYDLLKNGFGSTCYDGQYFFDTDHPVLDANGVAQSVANTDGGSGTPWFLIATGGLVKPLLYQLRKAGQFEQLTPMEWVKRDRKIEYGVHIRANVGFGFWQVAWGSKQTLNATNYATARAALAGMKADYGRPLGLLPDLLVFPPALEAAAMEIVNAERNAAGGTNVWRGTARAQMTSWLA